LRIATEIASRLIDWCRERSIPFGFNVESVAIRKEEIEASFALVNKLQRLLADCGLRCEAALPAQKAAT
jgi:hypothetical protein